MDCNRRSIGLEQARHTEHVRPLGAGVEDVAVRPAEIAELLHLSLSDPLLAQDLAHDSEECIFCLAEDCHILAGGEILWDCCSPVRKKPWGLSGDCLINSLRNNLLECVVRVSE